MSEVSTHAHTLVTHISSMDLLHNSSVAHHTRIHNMCSSNNSWNPTVCQAQSDALLLFLPYFYQIITTLVSINIINHNYSKTPLKFLMLIKAAFI